MKVPEIQSRISLAKNRLETPAQLLGKAGDARHELIGEVYAKYQDVLRRSRRLDFDDLLTETLRLLRTHEGISAELRQRHRYLLVDEYQDTNGVQFEIVRALCGPERNLCVVGDDDQSIYGWRGADVSKILGFERSFPGAKVIKLEENYRSTSQTERRQQGHPQQPQAARQDPPLGVRRRRTPDGRHDAGRGHRGRADRRRDQAPRGDRRSSLERLRHPLPHGDAAAPLRGGASHEAGALRPRRRDELLRSQGGARRSRLPAPRGEPRRGLPAQDQRAAAGRGQDDHRSRPRVRHRPRDLRDGGLRPRDGDPEGQHEGRGRGPGPAGAALRREEAAPQGRRALWRSADAWSRR